MQKNEGMQTKWYADVENVNGKSLLLMIITTLLK